MGRAHSLGSVTRQYLSLPEHADCYARRSATGKLQLATITTGLARLATGEIRARAVLAEPIP